VLGVNFCWKRWDYSVVAYVRPAGCTLIELEEVAIALENILTARQRVVSGQSVNIANFDALALPINAPSDEYG
jgi:hypothetical protein